MSSVDTKQRLIDAAGPIFARRGFGEAKIREICDHADANLAAVSYHFGDKQGLYQASVQTALQLIHERTPLAELDDSAPPAARLHTFVRSMLSRLRSGKSIGWPMELVNREILSPSNECEALVREHFRGRFATLLEIVRSLSQPPVAEHELEQFAFSVVGQVFHYHMAGRMIGLVINDTGTSEHYRLEALADQITRFSVAAITHWQEVPEIPHLQPAGEVPQATPGDSSTPTYPWSSEPTKSDA